MLPWSWCHACISRAALKSAPRNTSAYDTTQNDKKECDEAQTKNNVIIDHPVFSYMIFDPFYNSRNAIKLALKWSQKIDAAHSKSTIGMGNKLESEEAWGSIIDSFQTMSNLIIFPQSKFFFLAKPGSFRFGRPTYLEVSFWILCVLK